MALSVVGTPTPASSTPAPVTPVQPVTPTGDLQPVGLLPLPTTGGSDTYYIKVRVVFLVRTRVGIIIGIKANTCV